MVSLDVPPLPRHDTEARGNLEDTTTRSSETITTIPSMLRTDAISAMVLGIRGLDLVYPAPPMNGNCSLSSPGPTYSTLVHSSVSAFLVSQVKTTSWPG